MSMTESEREEILSDIRDGYIDEWDNLTIDELFKQIESEHKEIQQYRAIGTVSEFRELKEKKYDCDIKHLFGECSYAETGCSDCIGKLKIKDALEKATAKKPIPYVPDCASINFIKFVCPNCKKDVPLLLTPRYCNCGQKLDWSEGKE
ncbi:MAG: hypothetical protein IKT67_12915 [Lachnospiraceae bacterium]|nr:hypothetical protein [Lachnospiraceae bacterium]